MSSFSIHTQVDWTETWLLCLIGFHALTLVCIVLLRNHIYAQACILSILGMLCVCILYDICFAILGNYVQSYFEVHRAILMTSLCLNYRFSITIHTHRCIVCSNGDSK